MTIEDVLRRLAAGLDEDERAARAAVGKRGREAGAVRQHWRWERSEDGVVLTDGSSPVDLQYQYPLKDEPEGLIEDQAWLRTAEEYPSRVSDWMLPDFIMKPVTEPTAGGAQHIARHDPARALRQAEAVRTVLADHQRQGDYCSRCYDYDAPGSMPWPCPTITALLGIYTDPIEGGTKCSD